MSRLARFPFVERVATTRLKMVTPDPARIRVVKP